MATRAELYRLVDELDDANVPEALHYLRWLASDDHSSTVTHPAEEAEGDAQEAVEYAKLGRPTDDRDPLWNIVGIGRSTEPTDIREHKDEYIADAYAPNLSDS